METVVEKSELTAKNAKRDSFSKNEFHG